MDIRQALEDLIVLQDSITHLNAKGKEDSPEARALCEKREDLRKKIEVYVAALEVDAEWDGYL